MENTMEKLIGIIKSLFTSELFATKAEDLSIVQMAIIYKAVDAVEKAAQARKKELKPSLLAHAKAKGEKTEKGHFQAMVDGHKLTDEVRQGTEPKADDFRELLEDNKIKVTDAYDEVKTLVYNPSKVQHLIATGKLKSNDVGELCSVSHALKVTLSKAAAKELKEAAPPKGE
jgi:hypothetical protein